MGQFLLYLSILKRADPGRRLYLAIDHETDQTLFQRDAIRTALDDYGVARVVVRIGAEEVVSWIG